MKIQEIKEGEFEIDKDTHIGKGLFNEWKLIFPIKYPDGKINWKNFLIGGRWSNLITLIIILFLLFFLSWSYAHDVKVYKEFYEKVSANPYIICGRSSFYGEQLPNLSEFNLSELIYNEPNLSLSSSDDDEVFSQ